jgi:hypothetical protein
MKFKLRFLARVPLILMGIAALGWMVEQLWNWVVPALFVGAHSIDYLHAIGLLTLSRILFGGFRGHGGWNRRWHLRRWEQMTPEEREQLQRDPPSGGGRNRGQCA